MELESAIDIVDKFLGNLKPSGVTGFEGLVAILLQRATGQEFRLSSSGRQSGRDAASESGYVNSIKVEAKHYRKTTTLDLRELMAEINEAVMSDENLDIWVLAASRSVDDQMATSLDEHAERTGVETLILDLGINSLHRLAVIMAEFPDTVTDWATRHQLTEKIEVLRTALDTIAKAPDFEQAKGRLTAKLTGTIGYDGARHRIHKRLLTTLSDNQNAQSEFRQSLGIRVPSTQVVHRAELNRQFDEWWDAKDFPMPAVALGEEGTGKTWAVFDWAIGRVERGDMPIILPFAVVAQALTNNEPLEALLARLLGKWTGVLDEKRWVRRLDRWLNTKATGRPLILIIADGLNERADVEWRPLFSTLLSTPWRDKIAILATDRPHHWRDRRLNLGVATVREIAVQGYSAVELNQALSGSEISYSQIPPELLPLILVPRYCRLVADHYREMIEAADFTRDRLIYLEINDRYTSKLQYPLTDNRLFEIIRELAERARNNPQLNPRDLRSLIPASWVYERTRRHGRDRLPHVKIGKYLRFRLSDLEAYLETLRRG
jgi:hypothetical protein